MSTLSADKVHSNLKNYLNVPSDDNIEKENQFNKIILIYKEENEI